MSTTQRPTRSRTTALLLLRCPVCLEGKVFRSVFRTNKDCPACGVHFERESGYYLSAMFIAYTIGFILVAPLALYLYFRQTPISQFSVVIGVVIVVLWPLIFHASRILWLHADQLMDPRQPPADEVVADEEAD